MDTAPLVPHAQAQQETAECVTPFETATTCRGVSVSTSWLRQARVGGLMLNLRVFTPMGEGVTFKERLGRASADEDGMCLYLFAASDEDSLMLQMDQHALDVLERVGVKEIAVANPDGCVRMRYQTQELGRVRVALALRDAEQLGVSGEEDPITVVSEDGVRRQVTQ